MNRTLFIVIYNAALGILGLYILYNYLDEMIEEQPFVSEVTTSIDLGETIDQSALADSLKTSEKKEAIEQFFESEPHGLTLKEFEAAAKSQGLAKELPEDRSVYAILWNIFERVNLHQQVNELQTSANDTIANASSDEKPVDFLDVLIAMCLAGILGGILANLRGIFEFYRERKKFPEYLFIPYLIRPLTAAICGVLVFFLANTLVSSASASYDSVNVTYKAMISFMALAIISGFASQEFTERLKAAAATLFGISPAPAPPDNADPVVVTDPPDGSPPADPKVDPPPPIAPLSSRPMVVERRFMNRD